MKIAALVAPVLFVLVSMCGTSVPAPPGSVSGTVYFDANHNRVHDRCDQPLYATVSLTAADGTTLSAIPIVNSAFHIDKVPVGDAVLTLTSEGDLFWPMTQRTADGRPGVAVSVQTQKETAGVELASISSMALPKSSDSVIGVIFNDANENGQVDADECGIAHSGVTRETSASGGFASQPGDGTFALTGGGSQVIFPTLPPGAWIGTTVPDGIDACTSGVTPLSLGDTPVHEATIGFKQTYGTASVTGVLYDDANGNGVRDDGETAMPQVGLYLTPLDHNCGASQSANLYSDENGVYHINGLVPGRYQPNLSGELDGQVSSGLVSPGWAKGMEIVATAGGASIDLPLHVAPSGTIIATFFSDLNGDGVRGDGEPPVVLQACVYGTSNVGVLSAPPLANICASVDPYFGDNAARFERLAYGTYAIVVSEQWWPHSVSTNVTLSEPETTVDVALPPIEPVAIPIVGGLAIRLDVCYADPFWVQPAFEKGYDGTEFLYDNWGLDEAGARKAYDIGFYGSGTEAQVFFHIAKLPWKLGRDCPGSLDYGSQHTVYTLAGFEPIGAVRDSNVTQITVRARGGGLYAIAVEPPSQYGSGGPYIVPPGNPPNPPADSPTIVFVDESNNLIAACYWTGGCERHYYD